MANILKLLALYTLITTFQPTMAGTLFADLMVNKEVFPTEGQNYFVGDQIQYFITVNNLDDSNHVSDVTVQDMLPPQITYLEDDCGGTLTNSSWTWHLEDTLLALSQESCQITVVINQPGLVVNMAEVFLNEAGAEDPEPSNNSSTVSFVAFEPVVPEVDLAIWSVIDDETFTKGQTINLPIQVTNLGPDSITSSLVSLVIPAAITVSGVNCEINVNAQTVTWQIEDELIADQSVTCDLSINLHESGDFNLVMNVESLDLNVLETNTNNNQLSLGLTVLNGPTGVSGTTPVPTLSVSSMAILCLFILIAIRKGEDSEH